MGGIRKKTSKRGTTFQRSKIVKKAAETRKKNNRDGRKNAQWKSKKTTDPGIPNSFPFKDQILAELAQAKLAAQEEKERRRLAQKAASKEARELVVAAQGQVGGDDDDDDDDDEDEEENAEDDEMDEEDKQLRRKIDREVDEDEYQENPGVLPLYGKKPVNPAGLTSEKKKGKQAVVDDEDEEDDDDEEIPELIDTELPTIQAALDKADVVVEVLDARDPIGFRSTFLENLVLATSTTESNPATSSTGSSQKAKRKTPASTLPRWTEDKLVILLNKIDLVPRETAEAWLKFLRTSFLDRSDRVKVVLFKASFVETPITPGMTVYGVGKGEQPLPRTIPSGVPVGRDQLIQVLNAWKEEKAATSDDEFNVVFLGQPNVGKSAVVNTLLGRPKLNTASTIPVSGVVGPTTKVPVEVVAEFATGAEGQVRLIDTPGWEFNPPDVDDEEDEDEQMDGGDEDEEEEDAKWAVLEEMVARDMLTRNIGRIDKVKDALPLVKQIVNRATPQDLMLAYNIPHFAAGDIETFLISVARAQGRIRKRGDADVDAAAKTVLRDWAHNLFPYYTLPTKSEIEKNSVVPDEQDQKILSVLKPRAELKKIGKGLIRMKVPQVDERELILDEEVVMDEDEDDDDEDDFDLLDPEDELAEDDLEESGEEVEFDEDEVPSESEAEPEIVVSKANDRKRKRKSSLGSAAAPPTISKKVKTVAFAKDGVEAKRAEVKVGASGKLKRKGGDDDEDVSRDGKKARREELERAAAEARVEAVPAKREIKGALKKSSSKTNGVKDSAPVAKPVKMKKAEKPAIVANGKKSTAKSTKVDKPFDFNAI